MDRKPAQQSSNTTTRRVNGKLQWRVYGAGWVSSGTMAFLVAVTVVLIMLIIIL
jgi:hypothetical protein